jgi:hypothetical protein
MEKESFRCGAAVKLPAGRVGVVAQSLVAGYLLQCAAHATEEYLVRSCGTVFLNDPRMIGEI